ncbi:MAG: hypothetical protein GY861_21055 [bacterium]|nr:hypothetical protein [bacterium]
MEVNVIKVSDLYIVVPKDFKIAVEDAFIARDGSLVVTFGDTAGCIASGARNPSFALGYSQNRKLALRQALVNC